MSFVVFVADDVIGAPVVVDVAEDVPFVACFVEVSALEEAWELPEPWALDCCAAFPLCTKPSLYFSRCSILSVRYKVRMGK